MPGDRVNAFSGVKVFCATMVQQRAVLGETVTQWLEEARKRPGFEVVDIIVSQSSDDAYHMAAITIFFNEDLAAATEKRRG